MPAAEIADWNRYLYRHGGDVQTHFLLAMLIRSVASLGMKKPPDILDIAPWLEPAAAKAERLTALAIQRYDWIESIHDAGHERNGVALPIFSTSCMHPGLNRHAAAKAERLTALAIQRYDWIESIHDAEQASNDG